MPTIAISYGMTRFTKLLVSDRRCQIKSADQPSDHQLPGKLSLQASEAVGKMRGAVVAAFINCDRTAPEEIVLDVDGWDDPTYGQQQLSCFHGYFDSLEAALYLHSAYESLSLVAKFRG